MEIQWGKKREVTLGVTHNFFTYWGLPFGLTTYKFAPFGHCLGGRFVALDILCIRFYLEFWRWK